MILLSHPTGNQNSRQAAKAYSESGGLSSFDTAFHTSNHNFLPRILPPMISQELLRRDFSEAVKPHQIESVAALRELTRLASQKLGINFLTQREKGWASIDAVYHAVDRAVAKRIRARSAAISSVHSYEDGALETFNAARDRGISCIYELPIGYWRTHRRLCEEEALFQPGWSHTWHASLDSTIKVKRKDKELALANHIIVPSQFVADSLQEYPGKLPPISVIPYGCPTPISPDGRRWYSGGKLKILYVGGLSQRKGLSYLLNAAEALSDEVVLTIIGSGAGKELLGSKYRLLDSVPQSVVLEEMRNHDVFVFPSLFEGFGMVITEALSQGMPVIITRNTGPADMIENGKEGWIVPIRDSEAIVNRIRQCIDTSGLVREMGLAALNLAKENSWAKYRETLLTVIATVKGKSTR